MKLSSGKNFWKTLFRNRKKSLSFWNHFSSYSSFKMDANETKLIKEKIDVVTTQRFGLFLIVNPFWQIADNWSWAYFDEIRIVAKEKKNISYYFNEVKDANHHYAKSTCLPKASVSSCHKAELIKSQSIWHLIIIRWNWFVYDFKCCYWWNLWATMR